MDRTAVSGTAGTGSIPVGGARRSYPFALGCEQVLGALHLRNLQSKGVFT